MKSYPNRITEELRRLEKEGDDYGNEVHEEIKLLIAALHCLDFAAHGYARHSDEPDEYALRISIEPPESLQFRLEYNKRFGARGEDPNNRKYIELLNEFKQEAATVQRPNHIAASRLLLLLEEFYQNRRVPITRRLILAGSGGGRTRLECQGSFVVKYYDDNERDKWREDAQAEMQAFAEFLCTKVVDA
jgi:hypothetical protein